jgi:SAM-dependent methyltransferase
MPTLEENFHIWENYDWSHKGEQWSRPWGGTEFLWWGTVLPRIHSFLPASTILEIAPGYGRFTHFLKDLSHNLIIVDLTERCIQACRERFADTEHISYHVNNGKSLAMIPDQSIDFVFSFDSLVHAESDVIEAYLKQLGKKLKPDGVGFIHHSNLGACVSPFTRRLPIIGKTLKQGGRAESMTAHIFEQYCGDAELKCISQELVNWETRLHIPLDCLSVFTRSGSSWDRPNRVFRNMDFMREATNWSKAFKLYAKSSFERKAAVPVGY